MPLLPLETRSLDTVPTHLADDISICEPDNEAVLGRVVLVLILRHETLPGKVVRLPLWRIPSHGTITKFCPSYPLLG